MIEKIKRSVIPLIERGDKIIVGFSGGADSVCLLHALHILSEELGITVVAAHLNHGLREVEADRDEQFAFDFCKERGIQCVVGFADVPMLVKQQGISEELAGRKARYAFFAETAARENASKIATAHHKNDSAETILMHLFRGGALGGLSGIASRRGNIIRPLLNLSRAEIEAYCSQYHLSYVTDSTNAGNTYTRNRIRHECIPYIETYFNPNFVQTVTENASIIRAEDEYMNEQTEQLYLSLVRENEIDTDKLLSIPLALQRRLVRKMCECAGVSDITIKYIEDILKLCKMGTGKQISLHNHVSAQMIYGRLRIGRKKEIQPYSYRLPVGEWISIPEVNMRIRVSIADKPDDACFYFPDGASLSVRSRREGDVFYPVGMNGRKKLKDYFIDQKLPRDLREITPILICGDEIAWIIGMRRDRRFAAGGQRAYHVEIEKKQS